MLLGMEWLLQQLRLSRQLHSLPPVRPIFTPSHRHQYRISCRGAEVQCVCARLEHEALTCSDVFQMMLLRARKRFWKISPA